MSGNGLVDAEEGGPADAILHISGVAHDGSEMKFARALAASQKTTRDLAMAKLRTWMQDKAGSMTAWEMAKLWKGLYFCLWMADKTAVQRELITQLVDLTDLAGEPFLRGLFAAVVREWHGIDRHRIDKFYSLLSAGVSKGAGLDLSQKFVVMLDQEVFQPSLATSGAPIAKGVALHVLDRFTDLAVPQLTAHGLPLTDALASVSRLAICRDQALRERARRAVLKRVISDWNAILSSEPVDLSALPSKQDSGGFLSMMRQLAADKSAPEGARQEMYEIYREARVVHAAMKHKRGGGTGEPEPLAELELSGGGGKTPVDKRARKKKSRKFDGEEREDSGRPSKSKPPVRIGEGQDPYAEDDEAPLLVEDPDIADEADVTPAKKSRIAMLREAAKVANQESLSPSRPSVDERLKNLPVAGWATSKSEPRGRRAPTQGNSHSQSKSQSKSLSQSRAAGRRLGRVRFSLENNLEFEIEARKERVYASQFLF